MWRLGHRATLLLSAIPLALLTACDKTTEHGSDGGTSTQQVVRIDPVGAVIHTAEAVAITAAGLVVMYLIGLGTVRLIERITGRELI